MKPKAAEQTADAKPKADKTSEADKTSQADEESRKDKAPTADKNAKSQQAEGSLDLVPSDPPPVEGKKLGAHGRKDIDTALDFLETALSALQVDQPHGRLCGADVPADGRMSVHWIGPRSFDCTLALCEPNFNRPAVAIEVNRPFNASKGRFTNAVALLQRGLNDPLQVAISGWSQTHEDEYQLSNLVWTLKVFEMCRKIGHTLKKDFRDQGVPGQFNACHAEKQVLALAYLKRKETSGRIVIHVNMQMCEDCEECVKLFVQSTGMEVKVVIDGCARLYKALPEQKPLASRL